MLYSLIPPILVILSLIGIIIFLVKKAARVATISEDNVEMLNKEEVMEAKKDSRWKHGFLGILEGIVRIFRALFLKLGVKFNEWSQTIRDKRKIKVVKNNDNDRENDIIEKIKEYKFEKEEVKIAARRSQKNPKPVISDRVTAPAAKKEIKDRLEDLLIDRIAANPRDIEAYERLGEYYMEIESYIDAKECFRQIVKLDPKNRSIRYKLKKLETLIK